MQENQKTIYVKPLRAYKRLKAADEEHVTAYIYGISGTGKTELISRYLGKRKHLYFTAGRVSPEELQIEASDSRKIVVIDDLHELAMEDNCDEIREAIVELIRREDIWLILAGRGAVPAWLSSVRYREIFYVIEESELLLERPRAEQLLKQLGVLLTEEELTELHRWCIGIPLAYRVAEDNYNEMLERTGRRPQDPMSEKEFADLMEQGKNRMWDYLECYVYDQWDIRMQEFLMEISIVDRFTEKLAEMITGRKDVAELLIRVGWLGNFMDETLEGDEKIYELRVAMRVSMRRRLKRRYTPERIRGLYENAGLYYQLTDQMLEALAMYQAVDSTERIISLLTDNVWKAPNNGYYYELKKYYLALPEEKIQKSAELMLGMSMLQSLLLNEEESERWYGELKSYAATRTGGEKKVAKSCLLYLDIALPHRGSAGLIELFPKACQLLTSKQVNLREFSVTSNQASMMNGGKDFCDWSKKDQELAGTIGKAVEIVLGRYGKGLVNLALSESLLEKGGDNYEVASLANKGRMQAEAGGKLEQCFVADGMISWLHILNGKVQEAEELLVRFRKKLMQEGVNAAIERMLANVETFLIRCALYRSDRSTSAEWLKTAPDEELGFCVYDRFGYMTKVRVYLQSGRNEQAYNLLLRLEYYAKVMKRTYIAMEVKLLMAIVQYRMGEKGWDTLFSEMLTEAAEYHFVRLISREGAAVRPLLLETAWEPSEEKTAKDFWKQVQKETEAMNRWYPAYLKAGIRDVVLSDVMKKILKLQADGYSKEQIAGELGMTVSNVKYHTQQMYRRLGVSNKAEAVMEAGKRGLL